MSTPTYPVSSVPPAAGPARLRRWARRGLWTLAPLVALALLGVGILRLWLHHTMHATLPQVDGTLSVHGLGASVRVERDTHGVPHIVAQNMDDLVFAQGYVTAQDRLWQMDMLRRHAGGQLAELLGNSMVHHDRIQRYLQLGPTADRALAEMNAPDRKRLEDYAAGVNAFIAEQKDHLPVEFRVLGYTPAPWSARDSLLIGLVMAQDLSTSFPEKMNREAVAAHLPADLQADLYPVGSWRDRPPAQGKPDLTAPAPFVEVPLDESQATLRTPEHTQDLQHVHSEIARYVARFSCDGCASGSNGWVVAGAHTANGHPLLANDMHLGYAVPGIWYEADLESGNFHVAGVTLPGVPFVIVGHNAHIAWGFTSSYADVQDLYVETVANDQFRSPDGAWHPLHHDRETIHVRGGFDVPLDINLTEHGDAWTPILSPLYPSEKRAIAMRWVIYTPGTVTVPFERVNSAGNWNEFLNAFRNFGLVSQNVMYADDGGHIGYHLIGEIPLRGDSTHPSGLTPVPVPSGTYEWNGYIPFDTLPLVYDPPGGVLATANARITPDDYPSSITLDWAAPYRNERIWKVLANGEKLRPQDMTALQNDIYSDFDRTMAERIAYAVDHSKTPSPRAKQAADLLRNWNGYVTLDSPAPNIVAATSGMLWPMILRPHLGDAWDLYTWGERSYALEEIVTHQPARWLPQDVPDWNELLTIALDRGLEQAHAPSNLQKWSWSKTNIIDLEHPLFGLTPLVTKMVGMHTGTGRHALPGNMFTVRVGLPHHGASERFVVDPASPGDATLNIVLGQSGNPASPWYIDQWPTWLSGKTLALPWSTNGTPSHTLTLTPQ